MKTREERCSLTYEETAWIKRQLFLRDISLSLVAAKAGRSESDRTFSDEWSYYIDKNTRNVLRKLLNFPSFEKLLVAASDKGGEA
jgi:hypothetical protein